jgi:hypothetical protein
MPNITTRKGFKLLDTTPTGAGGLALNDNFTKDGDDHETYDAHVANTSVHVPSQTGNNGKFLTTNGTTASWSIVSSADITDATDAATPNTIVLRDDTGSFSAVSIFAADFFGNFSGDGSGINGVPHLTTVNTFINNNKYTYVDVSDGLHTLSLRPDTTNAITVRGGTGNYTLTWNGDVTANSISGNGSGLTSLNASNISSGTLNNSRLSGVALLAIANTFTAAQTINGGTVTTSIPALSVTQTWNQIGTTFTAATINVNTVASAAGSKLLDLQVGASSKLSVDKTGSVTLTGTMTLNGNAGLGATITCDGLVNGGSRWLIESSQGIFCASTYPIKWTNGASVFNTADVGLVRSSAGVLKVTDGSSGTGGLTAGDSTWTGLMSINTSALVTSTVAFTVRGNNSSANIAEFKDGQFGTLRASIEQGGAVNCGYVQGTSGQWQLSDTAMALGSAELINWSSTSVQSGTKDIGLSRSAAGILKVTDGSSGGGQLVVGKRITTGVVALTDAATVNTDASLGNVFTITLNVAGASRTFAAPTNAVDGQKLMYRIKQDATGSRTISWNAAFRFSGGTAPTLTTTASKTDYIGFAYNGTDSKWDQVAERMNF